MKTRFKLLLSASFMIFLMRGMAIAQLIQLPDEGINLKQLKGTRVGVTDIEICWNAPGVKGREGKIWGTPIAHYGFTVLGFGSDGESPWRAGANENTTISFSTDVMINGKKLSAGKYGFLIALYQDTSTLIFSKTTTAWGSYFYKHENDALRVGTMQQKDQKQIVERLDYTFSNQTDRSVEIALEWERWRIPFKVEVDFTATTLASIQAQLRGALGFDPPSLQAAAAWCLNHQVNFEEALRWINVAVDPNLGGVSTFAALSTKAGLLNKLNRTAEADQAMTQALENASALEMHGYGRQLLAEKKLKEAMAIFERNYKMHKGGWPTNGGMMRGYSAMGDLKKALKYARLALAQAPNDTNKRALEQAVKTLESGKAL